MPKLSEIATINGKPVYKDRNGDLCTETNGFQHLCGLTEEEEKRLLQTLKTVMTVVEKGGKHNNRFKGA